MSRGVSVERRRDPQAVDRILRALPAWFGIESAIQDYVRDAAEKTSYLAVSDGDTVGVALVEQHFPEAAELFLIAVAPEVHGTGVGTELVSTIEEDLRADGVQVFQVKTVGESAEDEGYAQTRVFYRARGFIPMEEINNLGWDGPTLIMVKLLPPTTPQGH